MSVTAIDLGSVSVGYPLLDLSRRIGVPYRDMLDAYERWATYGTKPSDSVEHVFSWERRWHIVLTEAFATLTRCGILLHSGYKPQRWPIMGSSATVRELRFV